MRPVLAVVCASGVLSAGSLLFAALAPPGAATGILGGIALFTAIFSIATSIIVTLLFPFVPGADGEIVLPSPALRQPNSADDIYVPGSDRAHPTDAQRSSGESSSSSFDEVLPCLPLPLAALGALYVGIALFSNSDARSALLPMGLLLVTSAIAGGIGLLIRRCKLAEDRLAAAPTSSAQDHKIKAPFAPGFFGSSGRVPITPPVNELRWPGAQDAPLPPVGRESITQKAGREAYPDISGSRRQAIAITIVLTLATVSLLAATATTSSVPAHHAWHLILCGFGLSAAAAALIATWRGRHHLFSTKCRVKLTSRQAAVIDHGDIGEAIPPPPALILSEDAKNAKGLSGLYTLPRALGFFGIGSLAFTFAVTAPSWFPPHPVLGALVMGVLGLASCSVALYLALSVTLFHFLEGQRSLLVKRQSLSNKITDLDWSVLTKSFGPGAVAAWRVLLFQIDQLPRPLTQKFEPWVLSIVDQLDQVSRLASSPDSQDLSRWMLKREPARRALVQAEGLLTTMVDMAIKYPAIAKFVSAWLSTAVLLPSSSSLGWTPPSQETWEAIKIQCAVLADLESQEARLRQHMLAALSENPNAANEVLLGGRPDQTIVAALPLVPFLPGIQMDRSPILDSDLGLVSVPSGCVDPRTVVVLR